MKKILILSVLAGAVVIFCLSVLSAGRVTGASRSNAGLPGTELPDSVSTFIQAACIDCHSDDGGSLAKGKLNFSKWNDYDAEKQVKKAKAILKELNKGDMPPKKWKANNPELVPTQAQIEMVGRWVSGLSK